MIFSDFIDIFQSPVEIIRNCPDMSCKNNDGEIGSEEIARLLLPSSVAGGRFSQT